MASFFHLEYEYSKVLCGLLQKQSGLDGSDSLGVMVKTAAQYRKSKSAISSLGIMVKTRDENVVIYRYNHANSSLAIQVFQTSLNLLSKDEIDISCPIFVSTLKCTPSHKFL